jgi:hypothetical protein
LLTTTSQNDDPSSRAFGAAVMGNALPSPRPDSCSILFFFFGSAPELLLQSNHYFFGGGGITESGESLIISLSYFLF